MRLILTGLVAHAWYHHGDAANVPVTKIASQESDIRVSDECVVAHSKHRFALEWDSCNAYDGRRLAPRWKFVRKNDAPYGKIKSEVNESTIADYCWTVTSNWKDAPVELQPCEPGLPEQDFVMSGQQLWSMVATGSDHKPQYCIVHERQGLLRTRRCYDNAVISTGTYVVTTASPLSTSTELNHDALYDEFVAKLKKHNLFPKTGLQGPPGVNGTDGLPGKDGKDGTPGIPGEPGQNGDAGVQGPQGQPGKDGLDGAVGPKGDRGSDGNDGKDGQAGTPGLDGKNGTAGPPGEAGQPGKPGQQGPQGLSPIVDGGWSNYTEYGACSTTCGVGSKSRTRACNNPKPQYGGQPCKGEATENMNCNERPCAVDGGWSNYTEYGACSTTCGVGSKSRTRACNDPEPLHGGQPCEGNATTTMDCNERPCPVDGGWSTYTGYGTCSKSCGAGTKSRTRSCSNPTPLHGGQNCLGKATETVTCNTAPCPVDGGWSSYTGYGSCSKTCGAGTKSRTRTCSNPTPLHGGQQCSGKSTDTVACNQGACGCRNKNGYKCYMDDVDNGGWRLVRRTGSTSHKWHQAVDGLSGTAVYGSFSENPLANNDFSRRFDGEVYNQFLFVTGDKTRWLIVDRSEVERSRRDFGSSTVTRLNVVKSSRNSSPHKTCWVAGTNGYYPRITIVEAPESTCKRNDNTMNNFIMYKGNGYTGYMNPNTFKGLNVFIRSL